ncbi:MAG: MFS transporter [Anaerolineae bacterium]|nr:MFS transporter [Anaerolineae bacterium]
MDIKSTSPASGGERASSVTPPLATASKLAPARAVRRAIRQAKIRLGMLPYNERVLYAETFFQAILASGVMAFVGVYLVRLGAPNWLVGLYSSLPALVVIVTAMPVASFVQRQRSLVATANWGRFIFRGMVGLFALLPLLPASTASYVLVGARAVMALPGSVANVSLTTVLGLVTSADERPRMLSLRLAINGVAATIFGFLAGQWLDYARYPLNYQVLFVAGFVAGLVSIYLLSKLRMPDQIPPTDSAPGLPRLRLGQLIALIKDTPAFRGYAIASLIFRFGLAMPQALYTIYRVRTLGSSDAWVAVLLTLQNAISVMSYFALGKLLTKPAFRRKLWLSCLGTALYPLTTGLSRTPAMLLVPAIIGGVFGAGMNIYLTNLLFEVSPEDNRPPFVAANSMLANLAAFVAPMLGTALADLTTVVIAFYVITLFRVVGGLAFWRIMVHPAQPSG